MDEFMLENVQVVKMVIWLFFFILCAVLVLSPLFILHFVRKIYHVQRAILATLKASAKNNAALLGELQGLDRAAVSQGDDDEDDTAEEESPADFVYCPECSTRVEVDPAVRNINVVCPDCKKPFHIH